MKLQKIKLEIAMARACTSARDLRKKGFSPTTISRAIHGEDLTVKTAGKIARALGVDVAEIMENKEEMR